MLRTYWMCMTAQPGIAAICYYAPMWARFGRKEKKRSDYSLPSIQSERDLGFESK